MRRAGVLVLVGLLLPVVLAGGVWAMMVGSAAPAGSGACGLSGGALTARLDGLPDVVAGYGRDQLVVAGQIMAAGRDAGVSGRDQQIGVMVAMGESGLRSLDHGDAAGPDSRGVFQQRPGWGPLTDRMDPYRSAALFFRALTDVAGRDQMAPTLVGHVVQRNADPFYYQQFWGSAGQVVAALAGVNVPAEMDQADMDGCPVVSLAVRSASGWVVPVSGTVSSGFGVRGGEFHQGTDIAAPCGTPMAAAAAGTVVFAGPASGFGEMIDIDHGGGVLTRYGHMYASDVVVRVGDRVVAGQQIARVGSNGQSTGCHLHLEVHVEGQRVDPVGFLAQQGVTLG